MRVRVIAVGKLGTNGVGESTAEYQRRAARYWPLEVLEVRAERGGTRTPESVRSAEAERLLAKARGLVAALDERGRGFDSVAFSGWLRERRDRDEDVSFLIGGALGLDGTVLDRASLVLSVAPWTLSHDLARLILMEQLYRAGTLVRGEPYHK